MHSPSPATEPIADGYDVLIVGAGAAGCACAAHLPAGIRALLIDRADPRRGRCCGGLLAHDAQRALRLLAEPMPEGARVRPEPEFVHALDLESGREQTYRRDYWNIDRARFDSWLLELACRRTRFAQAQLRGIELTSAGLSAALSGPEGPRTITCRFLVAADGATSTVRRLLFGHRPAPERLMAIQAALPACPGLLRQEVVFCERLTDFYAWAIPKPDSVIVGAAFSDPRHTRPRFTELLTVICARYGIERRELRRCARVLSRPRRRADLCRGDDHTLLVGEAAGLVSPSSGEGISFALQSGMAAACALASLAPGRGYAAPFARLARRVSAKLLKARIIRTPFLRRLALQLPYYP